MDYTKRREGEFSLVLYCTMTKQVLLVKMDQGVSLIAYPPDHAIIPPDGYQVKGQDSHRILEFSFPARMRGVFDKPGYDISGMRGTVVAFCIKPENWRTSDTFNAITNILQMDVAF